MKKPLIKLIVMLGALLLASCIQEEREYTLNPDGSGKVKLNATFSTDAMISFNNEAEDPEKKAKNAVKAILEDTRGVSTWSDVSYEVLPGKKVKFEGVAYFPDVNKVKLKVGSSDIDTFRPTLATKDGMVTVTCPAKEEDEEDGDVNIKLGPQGGGDDQPKWETLSKEEQDARVVEVKAELAKMRMMVAGVAADMSNQATLILPVAPKSVTNFTKVSDKSFTVTQSGDKLLSTVDKLIEDEEMLRGLLAEDRNIMKDGPPADLMLGEEGDPVVTFAANAAPQFDYAKEQAAALAAFPKMMDELGLIVKMAPPMTEGGELKDLRLAGVRMVTKVHDNNIRPFNWSPGLTLAFVGELPGSVISADEGKLTSFEMEGGQSMLPASEWSRKPQSIDISEDGKWIKFEVSSDQLPDNEITVKEISGEIECLSAGGSEVVDLGFSKIEEGATGKIYGAKIKELGEHSYSEGKYELGIHFELERDLIKEVKFYDADGVEVHADQNGASWGGKSTSLTFTLDEYPPEGMKVKLDVYTDLTKINLPFQIENIMLIPEEAE